MYQHCNQVKLLAIVGTVVVVSLIISQWLFHQLLLESCYSISVRSFLLILPVDSYTCTSVLTCITYNYCLYLYMYTWAYIFLHNSSSMKCICSWLLGVSHNRYFISFSNWKQCHICTYMYMYTCNVCNCIISNVMLILYSPTNNFLRIENCHSLCYQFVYWYILVCMYMYV